MGYYNDEPANHHSESLSFLKDKKQKDDNIPHPCHFDRNTRSGSGVCAVEKSVPPVHECRDSSTPHAPLTLRMLRSE